MKILHTSDWHIGRNLAGFSLIEDQRYVLGQLKDYVKKQNIDVLIVAGDVYDRGIPTTESIRLLDDVLFEMISETSAKVLIIAGNHDNAARLAFGNRLYQNNPYIAGEFDVNLPKITLCDEYGEVNFFFLPHFVPERVAQQLRVKVTGVDEAFKLIIEHNRPRIDETKRNVLIAHGFFSCFLGGKSDLIVTEHELPVGGMDVIDVAPAAFFDYVALGHLHSPQKVYSDNICYAGSLLKYSLSEADQEKGVVEVFLEQKGTLETKMVTLPPLHDLKVITGFINDILEHPDVYCLDRSDYIFVKLLDTESVFDGIYRLRQVFKNVLGLGLLNNVSEEVFEVTRDLSESQDLLELFAGFFAKLTGKSLTQEQSEIVKRVAECGQSLADCEEGRI
ncbi:MAG: exonuclease SbcCD subunit D [Oscillospiraceae bacterium]|jgi:exonuclease SbcD|nr:exonuclease SbcCD subunit D [Oscillospiraceae bacterium]